MPTPSYITPDIVFPMASGGVPMDTATIISIALEGILYGFSVLMFIGTVWSLTYRHSMHEINRPITVVTILLFTLSTAHMVIDVIRIEDGLVKYRNTYPGGPAAFFADISQRTYVAKNAMYIIQTLLADGVVIYRCYVVWKSIWIIILPSILWCSTAVSGFFGIHLVMQAVDGDIFAKGTSQWITAFFALALSTNLLGSGLLAYRIWMIEQNVSAMRATKGTMLHILRVLVDAAMLYSVVLITTLICFVCSNNAQYIMLDMLMPVISIAFCMVLVRVTINKHTSSYVVHRSTASERTERRSQLRQHSMKPLQVHISQVMHEDGTSVYGIGNDGQPSPYKARSVSSDAELA
ncbi:hypothetical protein DFH29DRAFT_843062 [Suillus ampliporus]|nr:hypothetical protein DFH29DRAFT_843062 [Suillus ampliporus]